jgi:hypothetical protein
VPATTPTSSTRLHFVHDRREIVLFQGAARSRKHDRFFDVEMGAVCIFERGGKPPYLVAIAIRNRTVEPFVERDVRLVLAAELLEDRREVRVRREAREERLLFVGLVTLHLTTEEVGDVARSRLVELLSTRGIDERAERFFEPPMRSRQLLERVVHAGQSIVECGR